MDLDNLVFQNGSYFYQPSPDQQNDLQVYYPTSTADLGYAPQSNFVEVVHTQGAPIQIILNSNQPIKSSNTYIIDESQSNDNYNQISYQKPAESETIPFLTLKQVNDGASEEPVFILSAPEEPKKNVFDANEMRLKQWANCFYCGPVNKNSREEYQEHLKLHEAKNEKFKCIEPGCAKEFNTAASLKTHCFRHANLKPFPCQDCPKSFACSGDLLRHRRYIHTKEKPFKCTECTYSSCEKSKLTRHIRKHSGVRPYVCKECDMKFVDSFHLKRHIRVHTKEQPYSCSTCGKMFTQKNSLTIHQLKHTGKNIVNCPHCPATLSRKTDLKNHIQRFHEVLSAAEKCPCCSLMFHDLYSFRMHKKIHKYEKPYWGCSKCEYMAASRSRLRVHEEIHNVGKSFACDHCQTTFKRKFALKTHFDLYHGLKL